MSIKVLIIWFALLLSGPWLLGAGADPEVQAGGVLLTLPGPNSDFVESGDKLRTTLFELLVPSSNRLLSAYLPPHAISDLSAGKSAGAMDAYAMAQVPRRAEYADCTPQAFAQILKSLEPSMGKLPADKVGQVEEEMNARLKSLDIGRIEFGHPEMLGGVFQKDDASGYAMLMAMKQGDHTTTMAGGFAVLRVKQRLVFAYLYRKYESPDTINWLDKNLEAWSDAILSKNK
jgi:hypothetical protein